MKYIDFDGVILDTEDLLFETWRKDPNHKNFSAKSKIKYIQLQNWKRILEEARVINDAIYKLKQMDPSDTAILTTVHSVKNEALAKIDYLRNNGVDQSIIIVPYQFAKSDIVYADNNILIDDGLHNLEKWEQAGGYPIFFDIDTDGIDPWGRANTMLYQQTNHIDTDKRKESRF